MLSRFHQRLSVFTRRTIFSHTRVGVGAAALSPPPSLKPFRQLLTFSSQTGGTSDEGGVGGIGNPPPLSPPTPNSTPSDPSPHVINVTKETFQSMIQNSNTTPTIIDCYADWCQPCQQLTPILEEHVKKLNGAIILAKINTDEQPELAQALNVSSLPTVHGIFGGRPVAQFVGVPSTEKLDEFMSTMNQAVADSSAGKTAQGGAPGSGGASTPEQDIAYASGILHDQHDHATAVNLYQAVLQRDDVDIESLNAAVAMCGMLQCAIKSGNKAAIEGLIEHITDSKSPHAKHVEDKVNRLSTVIAEGRMLLSLDAKLESTEEGKSSLKDLQEKVEREPTNIEAWYGLAVQHLSKGEHEESMTAALRVVRLDKTWNDGAGKTLLFEMFEMLGNDNELVQTGRRKLTNLIL